jgi:G:T-mismatch repair DNA endonuclease (very short patch repair protein)
MGNRKVYNKTCKKCGRKNTKYEICCKCKDTKEYSRKRDRRKRKEGQYLISLKCKYCEAQVEVKKYKEKIHVRKGGPVCKKCRSRISSETMKRTQGSLSKEERTENAIMGARSKSPETRRLAVIKQWETIRKDPDKWEKMQKQRAAQGRVNWDNFTDAQKKKKLEVWLSPKSRSKVSERLKELMIREGIYDNFKSEEVFHGFIPDEINHDLKIIVEMYGDLYHCNPKKYKDPCLYLKVISRTVGEQWKRDRIRLACFYRNGYTVVIVWENDFYNNSQKQIERIKDEISKKREIVEEI